MPSTAMVIAKDPTGPEIASPPLAPVEPVSEAIAPPSASVAQATLEIVPRLSEPPVDSVKDPWVAFSEAHAMLARSFEEIAVEVAGMTGSGVAAAADTQVRSSLAAPPFPPLPSRPGARETKERARDRTLA
jgi:hypothetical protein